MNSQRPLILLPSYIPTCAIYFMEEKDRKLIRTLGVLSTVGITLVAATVIGLFLGLWLDKQFGTSPWLTALFLALGIFAGFKNLFEYVTKSQKTQDDADKKDRG